MGRRDGKTTLRGKQNAGDLVNEPYLWWKMKDHEYLNTGVSKTIWKIMKSLALLWNVPELWRVVFVRMHQWFSTHSLNPHPFPGIVLSSKNTKIHKTWCLTFLLTNINETPRTCLWLPQARDSIALYCCCFVSWCGRNMLCPKIQRSWWWAWLKKERKKICIKYLKTYYSTRWI